MLLKASFVIEGKELTDDVELTKENLKTAILNFFDEDHSSYSWRAYSAVRDLEVEKVEAEVETVKPICPECGCETIVFAANREMIYEINSARMGKYKGKAELEPDDLDLVDTNEAGGDEYRCTKCEFKSENLSDFNPN